MKHRGNLAVGGVGLRFGGARIMASRWQSSDSHYPLNYHVSAIEDGYFVGRDRKGVGRRGSTQPGAGRTTTYYDTGYADVAVEVTWASAGVSLFPTVCVTPEAGFEHDLSTYFEPWFGQHPETLLPIGDPGNMGYGPCVVWNVGAVAWEEGIGAFLGNGNNYLIGSPRVIRAEVYGRRLAMFLDGVFKGETIVPPHMAGGTRHGVSQDSVSRWWRGETEDGPWELTPGYDTPTGLESDVSITPITHLSHEAAGTLGAELIVNPDFLITAEFPALGTWTTDEPTQWSENNTYDAVHPVSIPGLTVIRPTPDASPFTSGYEDHVLVAPLVTGNTYRLTINLYTQVGNNNPEGIPEFSADVPFERGVGDITVEFYKATPAISSGVILTQTRTSGKTVDFVADDDYTHVRVRGVAAFTYLYDEFGVEIPGSGAYRLVQTLNYVSVREFTAA